MIRVNISEMKNRLSHYLRLVKGGEEIEIVDRDTPIARVIHVAQSEDTKKVAWIKEMEKIGIIQPPEKEGLLKKILSPEALPSVKEDHGSVLDALLYERGKGR